MSDLVPDVYRDVTEAHAEGGIIPGIKTHIAPLDSKLMGLVKQDLVILAARPSIGKTAMAVQIALNVCDSGHVVAYFGLEGTAISIIHRMLASRAGVPMDQIRTGMFENAKTPQLATAAEYLEKVGAKFYMDFRSVLTPSLIRAEIRRLKRSDGIGLVIVDHIGLMRSGEKTNSRNEEIGAVSRSLKGCAKDFDVPVIALSQLNRDGDGRRPELKSLRDSGSLEQDADLVMLMYRETNDDGEKVPATEVNIAKARNGPTGIVNLFFNERIIKFEEMGMR
jgi:replicative DNA helicase